MLVILASGRELALFTLVGVNASCKLAFSTFVCPLPAMSGRITLELSPPARPIVHSTRALVRPGPTPPPGVPSGFKLGGPGRHQLALLTRHNRGFVKRTQVSANSLGVAHFLHHGLQLCAAAPALLRLQLVCVASFARSPPQCSSLCLFPSRVFMALETSSLKRLELPLP